MASVPPPAPPQSPPRQPAVTDPSVGGNVLSAGGKDEHFIESQLVKARGYVKLVDVATGVMKLLAGTLLFFLAVAMLDHWVVPGGLAPWSRILLLLAYLAAAGYYVALHVAPLLLKQINPVYAAHQIEQANPAKNSLINFLLFRTARQPMHRAVYQAVERQAAGALSHVRVESAIDRTKLIKIGYVLLGAVVLCGLYKVLSPKDPFQTLGRIALPWANIDPPTRVTLEDIRPGDESVYRGAGVEISAAVRGLGDGESVELRYTTDDRQIVDRVVEMRLQQNRYVADFPASSGGVQQSFSYRVAAGDALSRAYQLEVVAAPAIEIDSIEYEYPAYTQLEQRTETEGRDVAAVEGTRVTIRATANRPIRDARIEFELEGQQSLRMNTDGTTATCSFHLKYRGSDGLSPDRGRYRLRFTTEDEQVNPDPVDHYITIKPDLAPEVQFVYPREREIQLPQDASLSIEVRAVDRDFGLSRVRLEATHLEKIVVDAPLLEEKREEPFVGKYVFVPRKLGLKAEDVILYRAVAADTKRPDANVTETVWNRIVIVGADNPQDQLASSDTPDAAAADQADQPPQQGDTADDNPQDGKKQDGQKQDGQNQDGKKQEGQQQGGSDGEKQDGSKSQGGSQPDSGDPSESQDGQGGEDSQPKPVSSDGSNDSEAFERIREHLNDQKGDDQQGDKPSGPKDGQADPQGDQNDTGSPQPGRQSAEPDGGQPSDTGSPSGDQETPSSDQKQKSGASDPQQRPGQKEPGSPEKSTAPANKKPDGSAGSDGSPDQKDGATPGGGENQPKPMDDAKPGPGDGQKPNQPEPGKGDDPTGTKPDSTQQRGAKKSDKPGDEKQDPGAPGEKGRDNEGSGGQKTKDGAGADAETEKQGPKKSDDQSGSKEGSDDSQSKSPAASSKPSNSAPGEGNSDLKGKGNEGGGQKDNQAGKGAAGTHTPADDGGGKADQPGQGEAGEKQGVDQKAPGKTGKPSDDSSAGEGSTTEKRPDGSEPGNATGERQGEQDGQKKQDTERTDPKNTPGDSSGKTAGDGNAGQSAGGGKPPENDTDGPRAPTGEPGGDEANLEYTRKATDLALRHLNEELAKDEVDPKLLERLGWSKQELAQFRDRWEQMRRGAQQPGDAGETGRQDLDDALRSLGLRSGTKKFGPGRRVDRQRGLSSSRDTRPPAEYAEQFKAYSQSRASKK